MSSIGRTVSKIRDLVVRERGRLLLLTGFVLVGVSSFEAGFLQGSAVSARPIIVEKPVASASSDASMVATPAVSESAGTRSTKTTVDTKNCAFVGSKNSTLYHLPGCAAAKRIKPENLVCFVSAEDAQVKGYKAGCIK